MEYYIMEYYIMEYCFFLKISALKREARTALTNFGVAERIWSLLENIFTICNLIRIPNGGCFFLKS